MKKTENEWRKNVNKEVLIVLFQIRSFIGRISVVKITEYNNILDCYRKDVNTKTSCIVVAD